MRARSFSYRLPVLVLSLAFLMPVFPWAALRASQAYGAACHHVTCPHHTQRCTCHGHGDTPRWQRCHDEVAAPGGTPVVSYGPPPAGTTLTRPAASTPTALSDAPPPRLRPITDIFHPPRRKSFVYGLR